MKTSEKQSGGKRYEKGITLHNLIEKDKYNRTIEQLQAKQRKREHTLKEFRADSKTVFLSTSKEKAERVINAYKKRQINYKHI